MIALSHVVLFAAVGGVMLLAGLGRHALERTPRRTCPACGRELGACNCRR